MAKKKKDQYLPDIHELCIALELPAALPPEIPQLQRPHSAAPDEGALVTTKMEALPVVLCELVQNRTEQTQSSYFFMPLL